MKSYNKSKFCFCTFFALSCYFAALCWFCHNFLTRNNCWKFLAPHCINLQSVHQTFLACCLYKYMFDFVKCCQSINLKRTLVGILSFIQKTQIDVMSPLSVNIFSTTLMQKIVTKEMHKVQSSRKIYFIIKRSLEMHYANFSYRTS